MRSASQFASGFALALCALLASASAQAQTHYKIVQSTGASIVAGDNLTEVATPTCEDPNSPDDDCVGPVALPFDFSYYNVVFPAGAVVNVGTNGNLQFQSASTSFGGLSGVCFPVGTFVTAMFPHFADAQTNGPGEGIFTSVSGSAPNRVFNIEWRASYEFTTPGSLNYQIRLYESTGPLGQKFDFIYGTITGSAASAPGNGISLPGIGAQFGAGAGGRFTQFSSPCGGLAAGGVRSGLMLSFVGTNENPFIQGRVTDTELRPLSGVTVSLTGDSAQTQVTDATGTYTFDGLALNGNYTVSVSDASGSLFYPPQRLFSANGAFGPPFNGPKIVNFVRTPAAQPRDVLISEFRFRGPQPVVISDDFVELYNNTNSAIVVNTADGSSGWLVLAANGEFYTLPNGAVIPARGHFLVSGTGYSSLFPYAPGDDFFSGDLQFDSGVAIFKSAAVNPSDAADALAKRLDAAGFSTTASLYREGAGLPPIGNNPGEYSFLRRLTTGTPFDSDDNVADFVFVSTTAAAPNGVQARLGAPGPESLASPVQRNASVKASFIDPACTGTGTTSDSTCARVRLASDTGPNASLGTLLIRRKFTNRLSVPITRLRFRVVDITTAPAPAGFADLRVLDSTTRPVGGGTISLKALIVEDRTATTGPDAGPPFGPAQPLGGGLNTSLAVSTVTPETPLAPNASVNVEFRLGIEQPGTFRFFINVEALADEPLPPAAAPGVADPARKSAPTTINKLRRTRGKLAAGNLP